MKVTVDLVLKSKFFSSLFPSFSVFAYLPIWGEQFCYCPGYPKMTFFPPIAQKQQSKVTMDWNVSPNKSSLLKGYFLRSSNRHLIKWIRLIHFLTLKQPSIPEMDPSWLWCIIILYILNSIW
jgi:hypothetical protein